MHHTVFRILSVLLFLIAATPLNVQAAAPVIAPYFVQFQDVNQCTGEMSDITLNGFSRTVTVKEGFSMHFELVVTVSGGYEGFMTGEWVVRGDQVSHLTLFDSEVNSDGQRLTARTLLHTTLVGGQLRAQIDSIKLDCVSH